MKRFVGKIACCGACLGTAALVSSAVHAQSDITVAMTTLSGTVWPAAATLGVTVFLFMLSRRLANRGIAGR